MGLRGDGPLRLVGQYRVRRAIAPADGNRPRAVVRIVRETPRVDALGESLGSALVGRWGISWSPSDAIEVGDGGPPIGNERRLRVGPFIDNPEAAVRIDIDAA